MTNEHVDTDVLREVTGPRDNELIARSLTDPDAWLPCTSETRVRQAMPGESDTDLGIVSRGRPSVTEKARGLPTDARMHQWNCTGYPGRPA